ncbi:ABC transporter permease [Bacillus pseudomycoides]|nr:ABC transporter permease [Bacillus pseudomycoides]
MNFYNLALQNVKGNWRSYKLFFLSSCFSIFAFFMYTTIILHPEMQNDMLSKGIQGGLIFCDVVVLTFSVVFILYSSSIFIQSRKKEFGLLVLMGATKINIICILMIEQMVIGFVASAVGIGIGILFLKLFFMIFSLLLNMQNEMPFVFSTKAVFFTVIVYGVLFSLLSVVNAFRIWKIEIIHLLKEIQAGKNEPKSKRWLALFGIVCIIAAYVLAMQATMFYMVFYFFLVVLLTTVGTYFVCAHGMIGALQRLKRKKKIMYQHPYLFVVNQLLYRIKDNRRFFFMLTMMTTFVVTATGTVCLFFFGMKEILRYDQPHAFSYVEKGINSNEVIEKETVESLFRKHGVDEFRYITFSGIPATIQLEEVEYVTIISEDEYNREAKRQSKQQFHPKEGTVTYVYDDSRYRKPSYNQKHIQFEVQGEKVSFAYNGAYAGNVFNSDVNERSGKFLIMNEEDFQKISQKIPDNERYIYNGYELKDWENMEELGRELNAHIADEVVGVTSNSIFYYIANVDTGRLTLFVGSFISILFFLASCSTVYFKWFYNIEYDRKQYQALTKLGMTKEEVQKILRWQLAIPFFFPVVLGGIHSGVALYTFSSVYMMLGVGIVIVIVTGYILACTIYFFFAQREYMKHID